MEKTYTIKDLSRTKTQIIMDAILSDRFLLTSWRKHRNAKLIMNSYVDEWEEILNPLFTDFESVDWKEIDRILTIYYGGAK